MDAVLTVVKIAIYFWIIGLVYAQLHNWIFIYWKRWSIWIALVSILSLLHMILAASLSWNPSIVSSATLLAFLLKIPRLTSAEAKVLADEFYSGLGIKSGRQKKRWGLAAFGLFSFAGYLLFFGEICSVNNGCSTIVQ